jgi:lipopolysaccharide export system protein LptC
MKDRWLAYVPALLLAALAGLTYWLDQKVQPLGPGRDASMRHNPDFVLENFTATRMGLDGSQRYAVTAKKMVHYPDDNSSALEFPQLTHFDPEKAPVSIRANEGTLSNNGEHAYFNGDVRIKRPAYTDHEELGMMTSYLHVIPEQGFAETDRDVTLTSGDSVVKAVGLEFNNNLHTLKLLSNVRGTYATPNKDRRAFPWDKRR